LSGLVGSLALPAFTLSEVAVAPVLWWFATNVQRVPSKFLPIEEKSGGVLVG
jgi:hypothetical protein